MEFNSGFKGLTSILENQIMSDDEMDNRGRIGNNVKDDVVLYLSNIPVSAFSNLETAINLREDTGSKLSRFGLGNS